MCDGKVMCECDVWMWEWTSVMCKCDVWMCDAPVWMCKCDKPV